MEIEMHIERSGSFVLPFLRERAFELFTPEGERAWVAGWAPEPLHAPEGRTDVEGAVFRTAATGEETLWLVLRVDREAFVGEYVRVTPGNRLGTVRVALTEVEGGCRVGVRYRLTAVAPAGETALAETSEAAFAATMEKWRRDTAAALAG
jgi:hypothetical protein